MKKLVPLFLALLGCSYQRTETLREPKVENVAVENVSVPEKNPSSNTIVSKASYSYILETRDILNKVELLLPRSFKIMDADMIAVKYPLKQGAEFQVYTDKDATVNLAFEHLPNGATLEDLPAIKQVLEQQFNQPGIDFRRSEIRKINGRDFIVIEMITPAIDTEVYNLMFVTSSEGRLLMGTFNCTVDKLKEWQPIGEQIVSSVKVRE